MDKVALVFLAIYTGSRPRQHCRNPPHHGETEMQENQLRAWAAVIGAGSRPRLVLKPTPPGRCPRSRRSGLR